MNQSCFSFSFLEIMDGDSSLNLSSINEKSTYKEIKNVCDFICSTCFLKKTGIKYYIYEMIGKYFFKPISICKHCISTTKCHNCKSTLEFRNNDDYIFDIYNYLSINYNPINTHGYSYTFINDDYRYYCLNCKPKRIRKCDNCELFFDYTFFNQNLCIICKDC